MFESQPSNRRAVVTALLLLSLPALAVPAKPSRLLPRLSKRDSAQRIASAPAQRPEAEGPLILDVPQEEQLIAHSTVDEELLRRLEGSDVGQEPSRQAYLRAVEQLRTDDARAQALDALLRKASISERTGRAVLRAAAAIRSEELRTKVLVQMHEIVESDLVRGPLAMDYLQAAETLRSSEALTTALKSQLHPTLVPKAATLRALKLVERISGDEGKRAVLDEVVDHQPIDAQVAAAYRTAAWGLSDATLRGEALESLQAATGGERPRRFLVKASGGEGYHIEEVSPELAADAETVEDAPEPEARIEPQPAPVAAAAPREDFEATFARLKAEKQRLREQSEQLKQQTLSLQTQLQKQLEGLRAELGE